MAIFYVLCGRGMDSTEVQPYRPFLTFCSIGEQFSEKISRTDLFFVCVCVCSAIWFYSFVAVVAAFDMLCSRRPSSRQCSRNGRFCRFVCLGIVFYTSAAVEAVSIIFVVGNWNPDKCSS